MAGAMPGRGLAGLPDQAVTAPGQLAWRGPANAVTSLPFPRS
jgi:hypothetical protein